MNIEILRAFFGWCTLLNFAVLFVTFLFCALAGDWIHKMHGKWFPIPRDKFTLVMYCFIGAMKIIFLMLNLVPYLALVMLS
jgi:hypothetical protein